MTAMHRNHRAMAAYGQASQTLPPAQQLVELFDGMVRQLRRAKNAIQAGDIEGRFFATEKVARVIDALQACLDHEAGGDMARQLDRYYSFLRHRLMELNAKNDPAVCQDLMDRLGDMRSAWEQIAAGAVDADLAGAGQAPGNNEGPTAGAGHRQLAVAAVSA
ncbi:MAG: flagellar export chaperone FliS [Geminicoccaceae bacterium]